MARKSVPQETSDSLFDYETLDDETLDYDETLDDETFDDDETLEYIEPPTEEELASVMISLAIKLADKASVMEARALLSASMGMVWVTEELGESDRFERWVEAVIAGVRASRSKYRWRALWLLTTIPDDRWNEYVAEALRAAPAHTQPGWALADPVPPQPTSAKRWSDAYDSVRMTELRYAEPEPHSLVVLDLRYENRYISSMFFAEESGVAAAMALPGEESAELAEAMIEIPTTVTEALDDVGASFCHTEMTWPRNGDDDYVAFRAIVSWYLTGHKEFPDWEPVSDEVKESLIDDFLVTLPSRWGEARRQSAAMDASLFIEYIDAYTPGGDPLAWSPANVELFLMNWVLRKVIMPKKEMRQVPEVLRLWVRFALTRRGLAEADIAVVEEAVDECRADFTDLLADY